LVRCSRRRSKSSAAKRAKAVAACAICWLHESQGEEPAFPARRLPVERVRALVAANTEGALRGISREPCVNVLPIDRALDAGLSGG